MSDIQQLLGRLPIQQIAQQAGVGEDEARRAVEAIVPALVGGMHANAKDPAGARSLAGALGAHAGHLDERLAGGVDTADGAKIVRNVFGGNADEIARAAGGGSALGGIIQKVLPIVAPMVIAWIANRFFDRGGSQQPAAPAEQRADRQGGQQGGRFDSPFGDGSAGAEQPVRVPQGQPQGRPSGQPQGQGQGKPQQQDGFGLDDLLGGILGGGAARQGEQQDQQPGQRGQQQGGGPLGPLGDLLGGLLGGGRR